MRRSQCRANAGRLIQSPGGPGCPVCPVSRSSPFSGKRHSCRFTMTRQGRSGRSAASPIQDFRPREATTRRPSNRRNAGWPVGPLAPLALVIQGRQYQTMVRLFILIVAPSDFSAVVIHLVNERNTHAHIAPLNIIDELKHVNPSAADSPSVSAKNHVARHIGTLARKTKVEIIRVHLQGEAIVCSIFHDP